MTLINMITEVLPNNSAALHVNDIAKLLIDKYPNIKESIDILPSKISSTLSADLKRKGSMFSKPKNKSGGFKKGMYRLKKRSAPKLTCETQPRVNTQYTGCAGEHAVLSELLYWGFNASIMTVDDGIDVVASKDTSYFHIQVKTANSQTDGSFGYSVLRDRFLVKHTSSTFYIFVMRRLISGRYINDFIIMPSSNIKRLIEAKIVNGKTKLSFKIRPNEQGQFILNKTEDVRQYVNDWTTII